MSIANYYLFSPCCGEGEDVKLQGVSSLLITPGVYVYTGIAPYTDNTGNSLEPGLCYLVTQQSIPLDQLGNLFFLPDDSNFDVTTHDTCEEAIQDSECNCPNYFQFISCCTGESIVYSVTNYEKGDIDDGLTYYVLLDPFDLTTVSCYTISAYTGSIINPELIPIIDITQIQINDPTEQGCLDTFCFLLCEPCKCYEFSSSVNGGYIAGFTCSFQAVDIVGTVDGPVITYNGGDPEPLTEPICLRYFQEFTIGLVVVEKGLCDVVGNSISITATCPINYKIVSCDIDNPEEICVTNDLLSYYEQGVAITIQGQNPVQCWKVDIADTCQNPVTINVSPVTYVDCADCLEKQLVYYRLINCNDPEFSIYVAGDYSSIPNGSYISIEEYPEDCWYFQIVGGELEPTIDAITVVNTFATCEQCSQTYFILEDCNIDNPEPPIITGTDLEAYVGQVITLPTCPDICWQVSYTDVTVGAQQVLLNGLQSFALCEDCLNSLLPCRCQSAVNNTEFPVSGLRYINCDGVEASTPSLSPGERSAKYCLKRFISGSDIRDYGDCTENKILQAWECPPDPPKKTIRPGYNTPGCTPEKYEKIMCNYSESVYRNLMTKRYGVTMCCGDDDIKWEIEKELIKLKAIEDPEYTCTIPNGCDCTTSTYGLTPCIPVPPPPVVSYNCVNFECLEVQGTTGEFSTLEDCLQNCIAPVFKNYLVQECCTDIQYWTLPNGRLTSFSNTLRIGDCVDFETCYREMRDELIVYACVGQGVPSDLWTYEIQPCGTKAIKSIEPRCTGYYWYFVQNSDSTLTVYAVEDDGFGNYTIYTDTLTNSEACCGADYMTSLTNNDPGIIPSGPCQGVYTGTGFFDWFNRLIDLFNDDQNLHFYPYYDVETDQCLVDQTDYNTEIVTIVDTYDVLGKIIKATNDKCYLVLSEVTNSPTIVWNEPEIYDDCPTCIPPRCMSYVVDLAPAASTYWTVTYKDCNGDIITTPTVLIGEENECFQFCALEDYSPVLTVTGEIAYTAILDPIRECTPNDASPCVGSNFRVSLQGTGTVTYTDCAGQTQIITYDGTEPVGHLTFACLAPPYNYVVQGTVDIKNEYGSCQC